VALRPELFADTHTTVEGRVLINGFWVFDEQGKPQLFLFPGGPADLGAEYEKVATVMRRYGYIWASLLLR